MKTIKVNFEKGFSLVEVLIVVAIFTSLLGYSVINLLGSREKSNISSSSQTLISDIRLQQQKSMNGEDSANVDHGIYFGTDNYVLFKGSTYNISDPANFNINLGDNITLDTVEFLDRVLVFTHGSGEIFNFNPLSNSLTIKNTINSEEKTIYINKYGVISIP